MYGYDFHRQKPIDSFILDFFCQELMLGIEVDGYSHELIEIHNKDLVKESKINEFGIHVLRVTDHQILKDTDNVLRAIEQYIVEFEKHTPNPSQEGSFATQSLNSTVFKSMSKSSPLERG